MEVMPSSTRLMTLGPPKFSLQLHDASILSFVHREFPESRIEKFMGEEWLLGRVGMLEFRGEDLMLGMTMFSESRIEVMTMLTMFL